MKTTLRGKSMPSAELPNGQTDPIRMLLDQASKELRDSPPLPIISHIF